MLGQKQVNESYTEFKILSETLGHRPYGIRLAAETIKNTPGLYSPVLLLERLKIRGLDEPDASDETALPEISRLKPILEECLVQLQNRSSLAYNMLTYLATCHENGIALKFFKEWMFKIYEVSEPQTEHELRQVQDFGLLIGDDFRRQNLRLHTDLLTILRATESVEQYMSLIYYLKETLVDEPENLMPKLPLGIHIYELVRRLKRSFDALKSIYVIFYSHLYHTGQWYFAFYLNKYLLETSEINKKRNLQIKVDVLSNQALILKDWGQLQAAMSLFQKVEKLFVELDDQKGLAQCYNAQATILQDLGRLQDAIALYQKGEKTHRVFGNNEGLAISYANQANIFTTLGEFEKAMSLLKRCEHIFEEHGDHDNLANCYSTQATIFRDLGKLHEAMTLQQKVELIKESLGDQHGLANCYGNQALILIAWGKVEEALSLLQKGKYIYEKLGHLSGLGTTYWNIGLLLGKMGNHKLACDMFGQAVKIEKQLGHADLKQHQQFLNKYKTLLKKSST